MDNYIQLKCALSAEQCVYDVKHLSGYANLYKFCLYILSILKIFKENDELHILPVFFKIPNSK